MKARFSIHHDPQWRRLLFAILVALIGLALVNVTMAQSAAPDTSAEQSTSPTTKQSDVKRSELASNFAATGEIAGFVTAPDGQPLSEIQVEAYREQPWGWEVVQLALTDPSGYYLIPSLETGIYRLHFLDSSGAYAPAFYEDALSIDEATDIPVSAGLLPEINMLLLPLAPPTPQLDIGPSQPETVQQLPSSSSGISGTVTASDGTLLSGIEVAAYRQQPSGEWQEVRSVTTNAAGKYLFALETAIYRLRFYDPSGNYAFEYYDDALTLDQASNIPVIGDIVPDIDADLSAAGRITGTLSMFDGEQPDYAYLYLYHHNGFDWEQLSVSYFWNYPVSYDLGGLASGNYRLRIQGHYRNDWYYEYYHNAINLDSATEITVTAGITTSNINVVLGDGGGRIAGTVTSSAGTALSGIEATAYISRTTGWYKVASITTNMSGTYQLPELDDGIYAVRFYDPAGAYALEYYSDGLTLQNATPISVSEGTVTTGIDATLSAAGQITGTLTMFDGERPDYAYLYLYHHNGFDWEQLSVSYFWNYPVSYDLGGLASGNYRLRIQGHYRNDWYYEYYHNAINLDSATEITVTAGITTSNINVVLGDGGGRIAGTVTSSAGTALSGIEATAYISRTTGWYKVGSITTNMSGTYQLSELDDGIYAVRFSDPAGTHALEYYSDALTLQNATPISVSEGTVTTGIDAILSAAGHITGTLTMFDGERPDYAYLYLYHHNGFDWEQLSVSYFWNYPVSHDLGGLATGNYRLRIYGHYHNDYYDEYYDNAINLDSATDIAVTSGITTPDIDIVLGDVIYSGRITGTVTADGVPQEGILIDLYQDYTGNGDWWRLVYAHTDADGNYSIGALKDGLYRVRFSDEQGAYATVYYDGEADLPSANTVTITDQTTVPDINASLTGAGSITGTVSLSDGEVGEGISVVAYRDNGTTWEALGTAISDQNGSYRIGRLLPGDYRLYFQDSSRTYRTEYYNDAPSLMSANDVAVLTDTVTADINVVLDSPAQPQADVSMFGRSGSVVSDPWTGEVTVTFRRGTQLNTTIRTDVSCSGESTPTNVTLWMNSTSYSMTPTFPSGTYIATIPASDITSNASLTVRWECNGISQQKAIGEIVLYDPSGYITDAATGDPVEGATVTLYRVPNWLPDTDTDMLNCRTVNTRTGADWSSEPDASIDLGVVVNPEVGQINSSPEISPTINPQITDPEGYYGWDVVQGCWYVAVQADGYESRVSPVVGVPPEVTDLDLELTPLPPVADFIVSRQVGQAPLTVVFTDTSTGTVTDRLWNFGDGGSSEQVTLTHTYTEAGVYSVALMISNPSGSDAMTKTNFITVTDTPLVPDIDVNPTSLSATVEIEQTTEQTLTISNDGTGDLEWSIFEETTALRLPDKPLMQEKLFQDTRNGLSESLAAQAIGGSRFAGSSQAAVISTPSQMARTMAADDQSLTHSASQEITDLNSIACQNGNDLHRDNSYYRLFDLSGDFAIDEEFEVTSVEFGVQLASGAGGEQAVTVNLYTLDGAFVLANLTPIGSTEVNLPDQSLTIASVPVSGTVPAGSTLVVELFTPSGLTDGNTFFIGSNNQGQTAPSYIRAPYCDVSQPTDITDIGAPQMQLVMNVSGHLSESTCSVGDISWSNLSASAGTTAAGDTDEVTVTFDSTGLAVGTHSGELCIESNDPDEPFVVVPLTLNVEATNLLSIYALAFDGKPTSPANLSPLFQETMNGIVEATVGVPNKWAVVLVDQDQAADTRILVVHDGEVTPIVGLPDAAGQLSEGLDEYDMTDGETVGGFLKWALSNYDDAEMKTTFSYISHGTFLAPDVAWDTLFSEEPSMDADLSDSELVFPLPSVAHPKAAFSDHHPQRRLITPHDLQVALDVGTDGATNPLDVLDIVHCFSGSIEEFYELSNASGSPYATTMIGSANYSYFAPSMLGKTLSALQPASDAATMASSMIAAYDSTLDEADQVDGNPDVEHPRTYVALASSQLAQIKSEMDSLAWYLMQQFESNAIESKDRITAAYQNSGAYYDTTYCSPQDWELAPPDGLVDIKAFMMQLSQEFGPESSVGIAAQEVANAVDEAVITQVAHNGIPWMAPQSSSWVLAGANISGVSLYADLAGQIGADSSSRVLSWHAPFYTDATTISQPNDNPHPYRFVQSNGENQTWANLFQRFWEVKSEAEGLTLQTATCLPDLPPVIRDGELSLEAIISPDEGSIYVGYPTTFMAEIHTQEVAINPLVRFTVLDSNNSVVFSDTVAAGYLLTGTHPISMTNLWTPSEAGVFTLSVMVDPDNHFIEENEDNNLATMSDEVLVPVMLTLDPSTVTTGVGETFELSIVVETGDQEVDGAAAHLNFDTEYLEVVSITPGNEFSTVILNQFDNESGELDFAAGNLTGPFPSGRITLATITLRTTALTDEDGTAIEFNSIIPRLSDVTFDSNSLLKSSHGSIITIQNAVLVGSVSLQGRPEAPDPRWQVPLRVSLTIPGEDTPVYQFEPTTDASGTFTITADITPGTYKIRVKNSHTLQNKQTVTLTGGHNNIDFGELREGDANDDNYVTLIDFSILVSTFAKCEGHIEYDERADFNGDTCVTILDFSLLASNFAQEGQHRPVREAAMPEGDVSLVIDQPILQPTSVGQTFSLSVQVQAETPVDGAAAYIDFDQSVLKVNRISAGDTFDLELQNQFDNSQGTIDFAAGTLSELKDGNFDLLVIEFESVAAGESPLAFQSTAPRTSDVTASGQSVLTSLSDATAPTAVTLEGLSVANPAAWWAWLMVSMMLMTGAAIWFARRLQRA